MVNPSPTLPEPAENARWQNYIREVEVIADRIWTPTRLDELVRLVIDAEAAGREIRPFGAGYSYEDIAATDDWMIDFSRLSNPVSGVVDTSGSRSPLTTYWQRETTANRRALAHVEAGIRLFDLCTRLARQNRAPFTVGGALGQTLAGATATSTHGSEPSLGPLCDQVRAVHLVSSGGQEYWIEPASAPITDDDRALAAAVTEADDLRILRNDDVFNAVIVSAGRFGIIYSMVVEVVPRLLRVVEWGAPARTADVLRAYRNGEHGFLHRISDLAGDPPPGIARRISRTDSFRYLDVIMNSRRPDECIVRRRWETTDRRPQRLSDNSNFLCTPTIANALLTAGASALGAFAGAIAWHPIKHVQALGLAAEMATRAQDPHLSGGAALAHLLNAMWDVQIGEMLGEPINAITELAWNLETENTRQGISGPMWQVAAGTADPSGLGDCYRGNSIEVMFSTKNRRLTSFLRTMVDEAPDHRQAGYIAIRFTKGSDALLSMFHEDTSSTVADRHTVHCAVEVTSLQGLQGNDAWFERVEQRAIELGGRPHWGQQNNLTAAQVEALYPDSITTWRNACGTVAGDSPSFSNDYTRQRGLEPSPTVTTPGVVGGVVIELPPRADGAVPLYRWYSPSRNDNITTRRWTPTATGTRSPDYRLSQLEGYVFPRPVEGTVPLYHWYSPGRGDNWVTTRHGDVGARRGPLSPDYRFSGIVGYVLR